MSLTNAQIDQLSLYEADARFVIASQDFGLESREGWDSENPSDSWISWLLSLYPELEPSISNGIPTYCLTLAIARAGAIRAGYDYDVTHTSEQVVKETLKFVNGF